jgi:uncharacterized protein (DUF1697 family)
VPDYVAFLRAINLGRNRKLPMALLRSCLETAGFDGVETYIQTGNVRLSTATESREEVERQIEAVLAEAAGFDVPAIVFGTPELRALHDEVMRLPSPFGESQEHGRYLVLFKERDVPDPASSTAIEAWDRPGEAARLVHRAVHVWLDRPTMQADFFGTFKKVLDPGTNRNLKVVSAVADRWAS